MKVAASAITILIIAIAVAGQSRADLVIINAKVRTMDVRKPLAEAVAIRGGKIIGVGSNDEIRSMAGAGTSIVDAMGKLVIPGFNDAHVHFTGVGNQFSHLDLSGVTSSNELLNRISHFTEFLPKHRWLLGAKLDTSRWKVTTLPTPAMVDAVSPDNPVFLYFTDPTSAFVNSAALHMARVPLESQVNADREIVRDASGRATGVVFRSALNRIRSAVPANNATNWAEIAEAASNYAASVGVTSVQDVHSDNLLATYREMAKAGKLKTRIYECIGLAEWEKDPGVGLRAATGDAMVRGGCVKWMSEGSDEERGELPQRIAKADKAGLQVMVHAIGVRSNQNTIDAFEFAASKNGKRDRRFRIEHTHNIASRDIARLSPLSIVASMQPALFYRDNDVGDDLSYIFRSGAKVAFGSDASMIDIDPLPGIYAAVNSGKKSISVESAVRAYTLGSAYAEFQELEKGTISVGKLADLVILSDDIFTMSLVGIRNVKVVTTIMDGKIVFRSECRRNDRSGCKN